MSEYIKKEQINTWQQIIAINIGIRATWQQTQQAIGRFIEGM